MKRASKILGFTALAIAMFMGTLDTTITNIALPDITNYFKSSLNDASWISTIYVLSLSVFMITASKIADQFGRKKVMIIGLALFGGSSTACGLSKSLLFLIAMRGIQGIGGAIITPLVIPMAIDAFGKEKTSIVAGAIGAITALAAAGGPPIGGLLIEYVNWQSIFFINVPFAIISIILTIFFVRESYDDTASKSIDFMGMIFLSATLFLLAFGLLKGNDYGWNSTVIVSMFIASAGSLILFIVTELKVKAPMMDLSLFKEVTFTTSTICYLITGFGIVAPGLIFNYFLQNAMGYEALHAALVVTPMSLTVIISMPLGSVISNKFDARIVNFLGILGMSIGAFMLSRLTVNTSETMMILEMIMFGFALGFSVQALISSIKYIAEEKSGMGSGIVNAARQIGTCIGIAILVSILDIHVTSAKDEIRNSVIKDINSHTNIAESVKKVMIDDINDTFKDNNSNDSAQTDIKEKMKNDIKDALTKPSAVPGPQNNDALKKLYDGANSLNDGVNKTVDGQKKLGQGIKNLNSGMNSLYNGSVSIISGSQSLNNGLAKGSEGSQQLKTVSSQGTSALVTGITALNTGAKKILSQFSSSSDSNKPTMYDAVKGISAGSQKFLASTHSYVTVVNNTIFTMIKNDPMSSKLLTGYKDSLDKAKSAYMQTDSSEKQQYAQQIQMLTNLVNIYTVGTDTSVTSADQFEAKLAEMAQQSDSNVTVISSGAKVKAGAAQLTDASEKVEAQFSDGGSFKTGVVQLADGSERLAKSSKKLGSLQGGINKLSDSLSQLKNGSSKLYGGSQKLQNGIETAQKGGNSLKKGSDRLVNATGKIKDGSAKLVNGIAITGQKDEITSIMDRLSSNKDEKIADAFDRTFLIAAIILIITSICGLFTDKSSSKIEENDEKKAVNFI